MTTTHRETTIQRIDRQSALYRRLAELGMQAAERAAAQIEAAAPDEDIAKATADLGRATRIVVAACNAENALFRDEPPLRAPADDKRRLPLHRALCNAAASARPEPAERAEMRRLIAKEIEATLAADPASDVRIDRHLADIAKKLGLVLDVTKLPDELIGMPPRVYPPRYPTQPTPESAAG